MHPVLLQLHAFGHLFQLRSYGVFVALGFIVAIALATRRARALAAAAPPPGPLDPTPLDPELVRDLCFWILVAALAGGRLVYVLANPAEMGAAWAAGDHLRPFAVWEGGLVFYGGFAAAALAAWWYSRRRRFDFLAAGDLLAPSLALGHAIGRFGCYLAGCCFGRVATGSLGVRFPDGSIAYQDLVARGALSPLADRTPPLHPTQLYELASELAIFAALMLFARRPRPRGAILALYLGLYAATRFAIELFRGDAARRFLVEIPLPRLGLGDGPALLSTSQLGSLLALGCALWLARAITPRAAA